MQKGTKGFTCMTLCDLQSLALALGLEGAVVDLIHALILYVDSLSVLARRDLRRRASTKSGTSNLQSINKKHL